MIKISPSILSADFSKLGSETQRVCEAGADLIHVDVMDGQFVPNITIGAPVIKSLKPYSALPLDVHLMIETPERLLDDFINAGAGIITVHTEAVNNLEGIIRRLRDAGVKPAVAIKPATPVTAVLPYLESLEMVLVMTVEPGFGGQKLIESTLHKVFQIREECKFRGLEIDIEVDGGITQDNIGRAASAGANVFVAGSAVFKEADLKSAVKGLRLQAQFGLID